MSFRSALHPRDAFGRFRSTGGANRPATSVGRKRIRHGGGYYDKSKNVTYHPFSKAQTKGRQKIFSDYHSGMGRSAKKSYHKEIAKIDKGVTQGKQAQRILKSNSYYYGFAYGGRTNPLGSRKHAALNRHFGSDGPVGGKGFKTAYGTKVQSSSLRPGHRLYKANAKGKIKRVRRK